MAKETLLWYVAMATMTYFVMAEPPSIQQTSNSFNLVEAGDSLVLECTADIRQVTITWLKDELPVDTSLPEFEQSGNSLNITNIQRGDTQEGNYKCNVSNSAGEWTVLQYPIVVKVMYINDDFVFKPRNTSFYELDDGNPNTRLAWTNCAPPVALPRVTVEFINGSSGLPVDISDPRIQTPTPFSIQGFFYHQIQIHNATIYDVGNWICRAKHQIKTIDAVFGIEMYRAPPAPQNVKVKKFFIGKFLLGWDFVRKDIQYYHLFIKNVATGVEKSIKIIEYPSPAFFKTEYTVDKIEHKQQYEVELRATDVKNQVGEWSSLLVIDVPEEFPPYMTKKLLFLQYVGEGSNLEIECPAEGVPAPTFEWLANNVTLEQNAKYRFNGNKLTIVNMIRGEDMKIKCRAINKVGYEDSNEMNIKVEWLNEKFDEPPQSRLFYPSSTELNIRFRPPRGFKAPELRYMIDDKNISSTTHPHYSFTFFIDLSQRLSVSFTIRNPNILAEGKYKAIASNGAGTRVAEFQYALAGAPGKITSFKAATVTQRVILEWEPPKSSAKIAELGDVFEHRFDIRRYIFEYKESSSQSGVTFENFGYVVDQNYIRRAYVLENIPVGVDYVARIKCVDQGLQESPWSDWIDFKIEQNIRPFIKEGPQLSPQFAAGENATLTCIVESNDQVSIAWFKNEVQVTSNEYLQVLPNNSLAFYNIRNEMHDGKYYCQATNAYGSTKSLVSNVKVNYLLAEYEFTTSEVYVYNVDAFRNAIIRCLPPQSSPSVDVLWTTGLSPLITESDFLYAKSGYVVDGREYYALFVINAVQNDGQSYGCVALNPQLSPFYRITLTTVRLMGKPVWTSDIIIEFPTKDTLNVTWEKEREDIASWEVTVRNGDTIISQTETTKTSMEFTGTFVNLQYTYEVVMIDVAGQRSEPRAAVTSSGRPKLVKDLPLNYELKAEGENASLVCEFSGNPFPNITWYKDGSPLDISATNVNHFSITNDGQTLRMTNLSRNIHRGKYMCNATNQDGSANTREIDYRISYFDYDFAVADVSKEFYDIDGERFIRFQCSPPMSSPFFLRDGNNMYWTKDGVNISKSNTNFKMNTVTASGLLIDELEFNATANSVGTYRCVYVSRGERREHAMNLTLFDGPLRPRGFMMKERHWSFVVLKWEHPAEAIDRYFIQFNGTGSGYTFVNVSSNKMEIKIRQLIQSTSYKFTIYSVKDNKMSMGTSLVVMTSQQPSIGLPDKPVNVKVESIGLTEVTILWEHPLNLANNHPDELQYKIRVCDGNVNSCSWKLIGYVTQYKVTGLSEQTGYMFEVHAVSELGGDGEIYRNFFTTLTSGAPPNINGFRVLQKSWNFIQVGWDEVIDKQSLQEIVLSRQAGSQVEEFRINRDKSEFTYTSLSESTSYQLLIKGVNELLSGPVSSITDSTEKLAEAGRVTGVKITYPAGYETERIMIEWKTPTDIGNNNPIDMVYRIILCTIVNPPLCQLHTLFFNETSFTATELQADTEYDLTIFTMRADGSNGQSYERQFKTKKENKKPSKPKSIKMQKYPTKFSEITLSWDHPDVLAGNDATNMKYRVEHCEKVGSSERNCKQYEVTDTSIKLTELKEGQSYETRISAITFRGELGDTEIITFTTDTATTTTTTTTTISSTSTTTTRGKTTTTSTTTARTFPTPKPLEEDAGLSTGVKVGIAIAVIILIIIIIGSIVVYMRSRRTKNKFNRYSNKNVVQVEMNGRR